MSKLVCNEELSIIQLEYKINLHSCDIAKAILFQLFTSIQVEGNMHAPFQHQPKPFVHVSGLLWSRNSTCKNIILFSHEKVVVLKFDANYWFYVPINAKWLPLKLIFEILSCLYLSWKCYSVVRKISQWDWIDWMSFLDFWNATR